MSFLGRWEIDDTLVFTCNTHDVATGAATDDDSVPSYRVYEDETGTAIISGSMAKLDDANTTGFYSEQITLSAANGFEVGKSYSIYISATVDSVTGTTSRTFQVEAAPATAAALATVDGIVDDILADTNELQTDDIPGAIAALNNISAADVNTQVLDVLNTDTFSLPGQGAPSATPTLVQAILYGYKAWRNRSTQTASEYALYADDGTTKDQEATFSDDGTTADRGEVGTGA